MSKKIKAVLWLISFYSVCTIVMSYVSTRKYVKSSFFARVSNYDIFDDSPRLFQQDNTPYSVQCDPNSVRLMPLFLFDDGVCFPTGRMDLNIFVMKYRMMMNDIQSKDRMFGVVMNSSNNGLCEIGTAMENFERELLNDGRQLLGNTCRQRFRILKIVQSDPYMIAEVEYGIVDKDILQIEQQGGIELPKYLCELEREVYQALLDVTNMSNALNGRSLKITETVRLLAPGQHQFRLQVASDFSFAVCDMIGLASAPNIGQVLLQSETLELRLLRLRSILTQARDALVSALASAEDNFLN